jgi:hypothetical protein
MKIYNIVSFFSLSFFLIINPASSQDVDPAVTAKIKQVLAKNYGTTPEADRKFLYNAVDLNDDGKNEYLVALVGSTFCGNAGCTMLVLNNKYGINTRMSIVQFPVYVGPPASKEVTKGYSNIYVSTKGMGYVKMAWNGKKYPTNPSLSPKISDQLKEGKFAFLNEGIQEQYNF